MDLKDENDYEKRLEQYKSAERLVEEYDVEISYLKTKLEGLNKDFFHMSKSINYYETQYQEATLQSIEIGWKQKKANVLLSTTKQYGLTLQEKTIGTDLADESQKYQDINKEIEVLEKKCSKNTEIITRLHDEIVQIMDEITL